jgi:nucleoside diphosphate kinase
MPIVITPINSAIKNDIEPIVKLFRFTSPQAKCHYKEKKNKILNQYLFKFRLTSSMIVAFRTSISLTFANHS